MIFNSYSNIYVKNKLTHKHDGSYGYMYETWIMFFIVGNMRQLNPCILINPGQGHAPTSFIKQ